MSSIIFSLLLFATISPHIAGGVSSNDATNGDVRQNRLLRHSLHYPGYLLQERAAKRMEWRSKGNFIICCTPSAHHVKLTLKSMFAYSRTSKGAKFIQEESSEFEDTIISRCSTAEKMAFMTTKTNGSITREVHINRRRYISGDDGCSCSIVTNPTPVTCSSCFTHLDITFQGNYTDGKKVVELYRDETKDSNIFLSLVRRKRAGECVLDALDTVSYYYYNGLMAHFTVQHLRDGKRKDSSKAYPVPTNCKNVVCSSAEQNSAPTQTHIGGALNRGVE